MNVASPPTGTSDGAVPVSNVIASDRKGWTDFCERKPALVAAAVLAIIIAVELINFGGAYKRTGFYLDDWLMLRQLSFGPQGYFDLVYKYLTTDPRVIIRPIEALHFGTVFYFSGTDPFGWRLSNLVMEVASTFLIYLIVARLAANRLAGFVASMFFLTYPVHDSTHYWAVCSCVSLSLTSYLGSLWATLKAVGSRHKPLWLLFAYASFAFSIYGYEPFLPLCALNVVAYVVMTRDLKNLLPAGRAAILHSLPYAGLIASLILYQRYVVPLIMKAALHKIHFDPTLIAGTIAEGLRVVSPVVTAPFISAHVSDFARTEGFTSGVLIRLASLTALVLVGALITAPGGVYKRGPAFMLIALGLFTAIISYSIFGLNPEYTPTLITLVNRINTGAAFGLSIMIAGIAVLTLAGRNFYKTKLFASAITLSSLLVVFALANWGLSKPWEVSWSVQQRTFDALQARKSEFDNVDSVVLMNCPRYVNASPVFDGTWDFEEALHLALGRSDIKGGVVSERMAIGSDCVQDIALGFACAEYPFKNLVLVTPGLTTVQRVNGPKHFIKIVETEGTHFGLAASAIADWKKQVAHGTRKKKNGVLAPLSPGETQTGGVTR
ncbi:MAG: hypothetical protein SGJ27_14935 [Candidatus Melainabacteria bacterium]|nr:hypothetical protein [Candidatus Melainabacteria bacterium]